MSRLLLTGGTGYIGSHTAVELISQGHTVEILDNLYNSKIDVLNAIEKITGVRPRFYRVNLMDREGLERVFSASQYDIVIHFAGLKAVGESVAKPLFYYGNNIGGTVNLLDSMMRHNVLRLVFSSSATVYGDQDGVKLTEESPVGVGITNPYGQTKNMIEQILRDVAVARPDFSVTCLRYFNPVGAHRSGLIGENPNDMPNNLMPVIMKVASGEIKELSIFGGDYKTPDGTGMRDFIHVVDLAKGHVAAINAMKHGVNVYNLGTGKATSVMEMVEKFESVSGRKLPVKVVERRPGDLAVVYADPSKAERELGWKAELSIEDAMRDTINYLRKQGKM